MKGVKSWQIFVTGIYTLKPFKPKPKINPVALYGMLIFCLDIFNNRLIKTFMESSNIQKCNIIIIFSGTYTLNTIELLSIDYLIRIWLHFISFQMKLFRLESRVSQRMSYYAYTSTTQCFNALEEVWQHAVLLPCCLILGQIFIRYQSGLDTLLNQLLKVISLSFVFLDWNWWRIQQAVFLINLIPMFLTPCLWVERRLQCGNRDLLDTCVHDVSQHDSSTSVVKQIGPNFWKNSSKSLTVV